MAGHTHVAGGVKGVEWITNLTSSNSDVGGIHAAGNGDAARGVAGVEDESFVADGADSWISFRTVPAVEDVAVVAAAVVGGQEREGRSQALFADSSHLVAGGAGEEALDDIGLADSVGEGGANLAAGTHSNNAAVAVSYTHLTLPTIYSV